MTSKEILLTTATVAIGALLFVQTGLAQRNETPSPTPAPNPGSNVPTTPTPPTVPPTSPTPGRSTIPRPGTDEQQRTPFPDMADRPIFLSGKVMLDDGTPPQESLVIELVCNGQPRPQAYTDSKGRFSFQVGQNQGIMQDASISSANDSAFDPGFGGPTQQRNMGGAGGMGNRRGGIRERDLMACDLRAVLPGYRSDMVNLSGRRSFDNPDVGTIIMHRLGNVEGKTISVTSLQAPKDAKKAYDKGRELLKKKKYPEAQKEFEKAVASYPKYASAWYDLGRLQQEQKQFEEARKAFSQALEADSKYMNPYLDLAMLSMRENKWQEVADTTARLIRLDAFDYPQAYLLNSVANYNLHNLDAAEKSAREVQKLDTEHRYPKAHHLLGVILAQKQDYTGAAEHMRNYLKFAPGAQDAAQVQSQLGQLEKLAGTPVPKPQP